MFSTLNQLIYTRTQRACSVWLRSPSQCWLTSEFSQEWEAEAPEKLIGWWESNLEGDWRKPRLVRSWLAARSCAQSVGSAVINFRCYLRLRKQLRGFLGGKESVALTGTRSDRAREPGTLSWSWGHIRARATHTHTHTRARAHTDRPGWRKRHERKVRFLFFLLLVYTFRSVGVKASRALMTETVFNGGDCWNAPVCCASQAPMVHRVTHWHFSQARARSCVWGSRRQFIQFIQFITHARCQRATWHKIPISHWD